MSEQGEKIHGEMDMKIQYTALEMLMTSPVVLNLSAISGTAGKKASDDIGDKKPESEAITTQMFFVLLENVFPSSSFVSSLLASRSGCKIFAAAGRDKLA